MGSFCNEDYVQYLGKNIYKELMTLLSFLNKLQEHKLSSLALFYSIRGPPI